MKSRVSFSVSTCIMHFVGGRRQRLLVGQDHESFKGKAPSKTCSMKTVKLESKIQRPGTNLFCKVEATHTIHSALQKQSEREHTD